MNNHSRYHRNDNIVFTDPNDVKEYIRICTERNPEAEKRRQEFQDYCKEHMTIRHGDDGADYIDADFIDWSDIEKITSELCEEMGIEMVESDYPMLNSKPITSDLFKIIIKGEDYESTN